MNTAPKLEEKLVRHDFSPEELNNIGGDLARALATARNIDNEFDQVKASFKSKIAEAASRIDALSTSRMNGFEMRLERCRVVYFPKSGKKHYFLHADEEMKKVVAIEDMTNDDYQADLIIAEQKFQCREEIPLFPPAGNDKALLVVGRFGGNWFAALRAQVGQRVLSERLDSEQPSTKERYDSITRAADRFKEWLAENLGKESAKGFVDPVNKAVEAHKERVE